MFLDKYKTRVVVKGFNQIYWETFSQIVKPQTIHVILSMALAYGLPIKQLDVNYAF